jgi:small-conductance mechanosensitive channel
MNFFSKFTNEVIASVVVLIIVFIIRIISAKIIRKVAKTNQTIEHRTNLVIKYTNLLINILAIISLIVIWGVNKKDILITISSIATVVGVAMFAQWSLLSNITSGVILFFFYPFKIGDVIKIHDKDFPIEGEIEDISAFHIDIITNDGQRVTYPNNLILQKGISIIIKPFDEKEFMD